MDTVLEYKCPACGGSLEFNSSVQKMKCPYCDTEFDVAALQQLDEALKETPQDQLNWQEQAGSQWQEGEEEQLCDFICNSCGGQIQCEATTIATHCPFCGGPVVMAPRVAGQLRPDFVIPFKLDKNAAMEALHKFMEKKPLLPKLFRDENRIQKIQGIYVPFWLYDAKAHGDVHYRTTRVHTWSDSRYNYIRTSYYDVRRAGNMGFIGVPVDGSEKMDDALMESIEPYDLSCAVDFQTAYLAGYLADKYDADSDKCQSRANQRIRTSLENALRGTVIGYNSCTQTRSSVHLSDSKVRYGLMPVWLLKTSYKDKEYTFAMNGQTGRFVGTLPIAWGAFFGWWAGIAAAVSTLAYLITLMA